MMAYDKQKVLDIALSEVGYLEKATNKNLDSKTANAGSKNYTKYARDLAKVSYFNGAKTGVAWCAVFVAYCFFKPYGKEAALKLLCQPTRDNCGAGCKFARNYFKAKKQLHLTAPEPGDVIFFYSKDKKSIQHTGLVYKVSSGKVYTIEGNTSGASGVIANGGGVCKKSYALNYARIAGYGRPAWGATESAPAAAPAKPETPEAQESTGMYTVQRGDTLWGIAQKHYGYGVKYKRIMEANGMKSTVIRAGMKLKIPKA